MRLQNAYQGSFVFTLFLIFTFSVTIPLVQSSCAYNVDDNGFPHKIQPGSPDAEPHLIQGSTQCLQYNGKMGCCNLNNDASQITSYAQIDIIFGSAGDGCDHCSIDLKRFWCEYACSDRQADFLKIQDGYFPVPDPQNPQRNVTVQKVQMTVQAQTACDLYNACKRIGFVTSVSAMGSPAGFLNFQGHNAVNDAFQYIEVRFSYNKSESLTFSDQIGQKRLEKLSSCDTKYFKNCTCNNCEEACDNSSGFVYQDASVFEGMNWLFVGCTYLTFGVIAAGITLRRNRIKEKAN